MIRKPILGERMNKKKKEKKNNGNNKNNKKVKREKKSPGDEDEEEDKIQHPHFDKSSLPFLQIVPLSPSLISP